MALSRRALLGAAAAAASAADAEPPKLGIVGVGNRAQRHLAALAEIGRVEVAALSDVDAARMRAAQRGPAAGAAAYVDYRELLADKNVEAVAIVTPNYLHAEMAIAALEAGKHVLLEKPIGLDWEEAKRVAAAARRSGRVLAVGMQRRYAPDYTAIREFVGAGGLGRLRLVSLNEYRGDWNPATTLARDPETGRDVPWRHSRRLAGSSLLEFSVHSYAFLQETIGSPLAECSATGGAVRWPDRTTEDAVAVVARFENDARLSHTYCGFAAGAPWRLTLVGERGSLDYNRAAVTVRRDGERPFDLTWEKETGASNEVAMYRGFFASIRSGAANPLNAEFALEAAKLAYAARLSIDEGRIVRAADFP